MSTMQIKGKTYKVDQLGFLLNYRDWDEDFAEGMAPDLQIPNGLTRKHWQVIHFIRDTLQEYGKCPLVYQTCRMNGLKLRELKELFPTGYLRGACKISGLTYREGYLHHYTFLPLPEEELKAAPPDKHYTVDIRGFLVDPHQWDEQYALYKTEEMKMPQRLTEQHWRIIKYLRETYFKTGEVPTVYETCEALNLEINELGDLFPDGYHRGAVKIAGLRVR